MCHKKQFGKIVLEQLSGNFQISSNRFGYATERPSNFFFKSFLRVH